MVSTMKIVDTKKAALRSGSTDGVRVNRTGRRFLSVLSPESSVLGFPRYVVTFVTRHGLLVTAFL